MRRPFDRPKDEVLEIALTVHTRHDPIFVDTLRLERVLEKAGYTVHIAELVWPTDAEWATLTDPMHRAETRGRHFRETIDSDYIVRPYEGTGGGWVRDYEDPDRDLEAV